MMKYLIYSSTAKPQNVAHLLPNSGTTDHSQFFDSAIAYCGQTTEEFTRICERPYRFAIHRQGAKIDNFVALASSHPEVLEYDYVVFADDDILISPLDLKLFLETTESLNLELAQPAHSKNSHLPYWYFLKQKPGVECEFVNFVEIQFFALRGSVLRETFKHWKNFSSGFGLDLFLSLHLKDRRDKIAIIHSTTMTHLLRDESETIRGLKQDFQPSAERALQFVERHFELKSSAFAAVLPHKSFGIQGTTSGFSSLYWHFWLHVVAGMHRIRMLDYNVVHYSQSSAASDTHATVLGYLNGYLRWMRPRIAAAVTRPKLDWEIPRAARNRIEKFIDRRTWLRVFEIGSGASSLFFLQHGCFVSGIDPCKNRIQEVRQRTPKWCEGSLRLRTTGDGTASAAQFAADLALSPDEYFDLIRVDVQLASDATDSCLEQAARKLKAGGLLIVEQLDATALPEQWTKNWHLETFSSSERNAEPSQSRRAVRIFTKPGNS